MSEIADVCVIVEDGYPFRLDDISLWTEDLIAALAPLTVSLVHIATEGSASATPVLEPPLHVARVGHVHLGARGMTLHGLELGGGPAQAAAGALSRMLSRSARARYHEAVQRAAPLFKAIARGLGAGESTAVLDEALQVVAGDGPWGLNPKGLLEGEVAEAALMGSAPDDESPPHGVATRTLVRAVLEPLAHVLQVKVPAARLYYSVGGSFASIVAAVAAARSGGAPVVLAEASQGLEQRLLQLHRGWELGAPATETSLERLQERAALLLHRIGLERADAIVATGEHDRAFLMQCGAPAERVRVIRPGSHIPPRNGSPPPHVPVVGSPPPHFVATWGSVDALHDTLSFIRCARELIDRLDLVRFVSIGALSSHATYYHACVEELRVLMMGPLLRFLGPRREEDVLNQLHCLVATAIGTRGAPAVAEAMSLGIPVVAVDTPPHRELLGGEEAAGVLVPPGSPTALAEAVEGVLGDDAWRERLVKAGHARAREHLHRTRLLLEHRALVDGLLERSRASTTAATAD
jgi:glycosyltransferase involved in cell wall biosynthesis